MRKHGIIYNDIALWRKGLYTIRAPLDVTNLTDGIMEALDDPGTKGQIFEAMGPHQYLQSELIDWMNEVMHTPNFERKNLLLSPVTWAKTMWGTYVPIGTNNSSAPTLERLERVSFVFSSLILC